MTNRYEPPSIEEYLRHRLTPTEAAIPVLRGVEMFGKSIPAGAVGGDLFEYINFSQRYDIDARVDRARQRAKEFLEPLPPGEPIRNVVDDQIEWLKSTPGYRPEMETEYRFAKSCEQVRVAEDLPALHNTAGILIVDAEGHGIISAKIACTVHDTFHALLLEELDRFGKTTPELFENLNLRLALSASARNELGLANFGHPPPLIFSAESSRLLNVDESQMAQFLSLGLQLPADHPDLKKYLSLDLRKREFASSDLGEIRLINPGDILMLYTDGVYDGSDEDARKQLESILREHQHESAREICAAIMNYALEQDDLHRHAGDEDLIDDKTVFIVKRTE
jgi:serine phosphatase RsbU (regulator of sigma subunit)